MKKCDFENCQYPMCDMECGLSLSELAESLVEENEELREEIAKFNDKMWEIRKLTSPYLYTKDYTPTCPLGHTDCLNDPAYLRKHNHNIWVSLGRPINCIGVLQNEETSFCSNYKVNLSEGEDFLILKCPTFNDRDADYEKLYEALKQKIY